MPEPSEDFPDCSECGFRIRDRPCRAADGTLDIPRLARVYLINGRNTGLQASTDDSFWAFECLNDIVEASPEIAFRCVLAALDLCEGDTDMAYLAAGPMEDLVIRHGPQLIDAIEEEAVRNARFRALLSGIWGESRTDPAVWSRIQIALRTGPWLDDDPRTPHGSRRRRGSNER